MKIDNGTGGSRETSTGKPARVEERGRESINFFAELKRRNVYKVAVRMRSSVGCWSKLPHRFSRSLKFRIGLRQVSRARDRDRISIALVIAWAFELTACSKELR